MAIFSRSNRNKFLAVLFSTALFTGLAIILVMALELPLERHAIVVLGIGLVVSLFEEFYIQGHSGRWLRAMHPLKSIAIYSALIASFSLVVMLLVHGLLGHQHQAAGGHGLHGTSWLMFIVMPELFAVSIVAIMTLRIIGYLGGSNLLDLMTGKYYRPILEQRIFLFLDINGSTALVERLGPLEARALIGKFFFDISGPIANHGGDIYRFTGDGVVAVWDWKEGVGNNRIIRSVDAIRRIVERESENYRARFDCVPEYRIGIHGGPIVTSEEGDIKRAIGYYGDTIHIAARLEQKAKELEVECLLSGKVAAQLSDPGRRLKLIGKEAVRGTTDPIDIFELRPAA